MQEAAVLRARSLVEDRAALNEQVAMFCTYTCRDAHLLYHSF